MRWYKKEKIDKPRPKLGDTLIKKEFLLFPLCINKEYRWLETVNIKYEYRECREYYGRGYEEYNAYVATAFLDT